MSIDEIAPKALQLSPRERAHLAETLWESIEDLYALPVARTDQEAVELAVSRDRKLDAGAVAPASHSELMSRLKE